MCNDKSERDEDMEKLSQNRERDQKEARNGENLSLDEMLDKGMKQYDELLKKLSRN